MCTTVELLDLQEEDGLFAVGNVGSHCIAMLYNKWNFSMRTPIIIQDSSARTQFSIPEMVAPLLVLFRTLL